MIDVSDMPEVWEAIQRERNALLESRAGEKRPVLDWIQSVTSRVNAKRLASGLATWSLEDVYLVWLIMSIQAEEHMTAVTARLVERLKEHEPMPNDVPGEEAPPKSVETGPDSRVKLVH